MGNRHESLTTLCLASLDRLPLPAPSRLSLQGGKPRRPNALCCGHRIWDIVQVMVCSSSSEGRSLNCPSEVA